MVNILFTDSELSQCIKGFTSTRQASNNGERCARIGQFDNIILICHGQPICLRITQNERPSLVKPFRAARVLTALMMVEMNQGIPMAEMVA